ncbi:MAG: putative NAD/FAD-binding protein [Glaciecola sp.]
MKVVLVRVAIIGSGIAGMGAAWLLSRPETNSGASLGGTREVHLFEAAERLGGHTHTHTLDDNGESVNVDTGFIVYNEPTYPNLTRLFGELGTATQASDMSFGLQDLASGFAYAGSKEGLFPRWKDTLDPKRVKLATGILRFNRLARKMLDDPRASRMTLGAFLRAVRLDGLVADNYVLPMAAAIWSTGTGPVRDFPLKAFLDFFNNHGLLGLKSHHPWRTVTGGSSEYIAALTAPYADHIHLGHAVDSVSRGHNDPAGAVQIRLADGTVHHFDKVVIAAHADQSLAMLADPSAAEKELLGPWEFSTNEAWLHTDRSLMPPSRTAWASWNVSVDEASRPEPSVSLTYWMNHLQSIESETEWLVTLNPSLEPDPALVRKRMTYSHPMFTPESVATQNKIDSELNGANDTYFCGAWQRYGFHEDGLWSAVRMARHFGVQWGVV